MHDLISVIVPVYNVADYLPECLDSILGQDHKALEVILIDDGSTDASGAICDAYSQKDLRVRVIHQKNGGAAAAKNAGLRVASGAYLCFADSDDVVPPGAYSHMHRLLEEYAADAAECSFRYVSKSGTEDMHLYPERKVVTGKEYLVGFTTGWNCALLWNKLYKRELFSGVFFEEGHRIDDEYFTYQGMMNARKVVCDDRIVYNYRRRRSGAMLNPKAGEQRMLDRLDYMEKRRRKVANRFPDLKETFDREFVDAMIYFTQYPENTLHSIQCIRKQLLRYLTTPGNTIPPKYLWKGVAKVLLTSAPKLLGQCPKPDQQNLEDCFD